LLFEKISQAKQVFFYLCKGKPKNWLGQIRKIFKINKPKSTLTRFKKNDTQIQ
jgi:hypothetical protein